MTVPSTAYWTNGVQKLKAVSQRMSFLLKVLAIFSFFAPLWVLKKQQ